jgi:hypothetical protein
VVDAKNKFSKQKLFEDGWARHFPGMVEWLPLDITGGVKAVDAASNTIITEDEMFQASVANVVPPQKAGEIAQEAGLADESGWCPIVPPRGRRHHPRRHAQVRILGEQPSQGLRPGAFGRAGRQTGLQASLPEHLLEPDNNR